LVSALRSRRFTFGVCVVYVVCSLMCTRVPDGRAHDNPE
jgi:hypothetical protein